MKPGPLSTLREFLEAVKGAELIESFEIISETEACVVTKMPLTFISVKMDVLDEREKEGGCC